MFYQFKNKILVFFAVIVVALIFLVPTTYKSITGEKLESWISKPILLGLDLQGGAHLVYEVQVEEAVTSRLQAVSSDIKSMLRGDKIPVIKANITGTEVSFTLLNKTTLDIAKNKIKENFSEIEYVRDVDGENGQVDMVYKAKDVAGIERMAVTKSVETLRNRVDQFGVSEPMIQRKGEKQIVLQMPGATNIEEIKKIIGSVAKLEFRLVAEGEATARSITLKDREGNSYRIEDTALMNGDTVKDARVVFSQQTGSPEVSMSFTSEGGRTFGRITSENVGKRLAIILDNVVYSAPNINEAITGGSASITGGFSLQEANQLALVLRAGALPASLKILEERTVGPSLGQESIKSGIIAITVGFALIIVFMVFYYRKCGLVAVCSLALNLLLVLACLSAFGATLTLPGLAGLALTIGMAVDSNVIIFERIREELTKGVTRDVAVNIGFEKAFTAIIDSNLTTLLTGIILFYFGTGSVKGFAVTLSIGVLTTLYCATFASRLVFSLFELKNKKTNTLSI